MSITLSVLTPTGRRQTVKVTPNTTILQVLEEVCVKQKLDASEFDLRHHSRILDPSSVVRFSQLPNNAQLEMVEAKKKRQESPVNIMLQLEDGTRLNGDFLPKCSLKDVISNLCPSETGAVENPAIIYMRKEITGLEELNKTTLKDLGLTSGRALLRFLNRSKEQLSQQLHVSNPLKPVKVEIQETPISQSPLSISDSKSAHESKIFDESTSGLSEAAQTSVKGEENMDTISQAPKNSEMSDDNWNQIDAESRLSLKRVSGAEIPNGSDSMDWNESDSAPSEKKLSKCQELVEPKPEPEPEPEIDVSNIEFLGEREALLYNLSDLRSSRIKDDSLPDGFFDLTLDDARSLMRDYKRAREELENAVLSTKAMKDLSDSRRMLAHLNKYQQTVVRIQFPDRFVLQGVFRPRETVQHVLSFVKQFIQNPESEFYLYTAPPKTILNPSETLIEADCVPAAVIYLGSSNQSSPSIQEKYISKAVEPDVAAYFARKSRKSRNDTIAIKEEGSSNQSDYEMECLPGPSNGNSNISSSKNNPFQYNKAPNAKLSNTVPKWFKPT